MYIVEVWIEFNNGKISATVIYHLNKFHLVVWWEYEKTGYVHELFLHKIGINNSLFLQHLLQGFEFFTILHNCIF